MARETVDLCDVPVLHLAAVIAARQALLPLGDAQDLATLFSVLADPTRVRLIAVLIDRELCVCDLANVLAIRQSTVSHQLRLLRALRVVRFRKEGRTAFYTIADTHIADLLAQSLAHIREESGQRDEDERGSA